MSFRSVSCPSLQRYACYGRKAHILTASKVANLSAILYSSALSVQIFGTVFFAVPRFLWVLLASAATLALSLGGRNVFQHILENLLPLLGYWTICFASTLAIEHYIFRPRLGGYDLDGWRDSKRTPLGLAGVATMCLAIGLSFLGMNQTWVRPTDSPSLSSGTHEIYPQGNGVKGIYKG